MAGQRARVLETVIEGPSTSVEIAAVTGIPRQHCSAILRYLCLDVKVLERRIMHTGTRGRAPWLYQVRERITA